MQSQRHISHLPWVSPDMPLPAPTQAWAEDTTAPGLLTAGEDLSAARLEEAYRQGIFPWFSPGQPVLWWSTDPRMVLHPPHFRFHRSLKQTLKRWLLTPGFEMSFDRDFGQVIRQCAGVSRPGQTGTWIVPDMVSAYEDLHRQGLAHSCEVWISGKLVAGLYFVAIGHAVFGESMFAHVTDGSKMALAQLVSVCQHHRVPMIDCQQKTQHLASMGAYAIPRSQFLNSLHDSVKQAPITWADEYLYWNTLTAQDPRP